MSDSQQEIYKAISKRVKKRFEQRKEFFSHLVGYLIALAFVVFMDSTGQIIGNTFRFIVGLATVGWTIGIFIHATQWVFSELEDRALARELERAGLYTGNLKLKNEERLVRLSDDGELAGFLADDETNGARQAENS